MAGSLRHQHTLEELARELDMVVYRLELPPPADAEDALKERRRLRRELERLRDEVEDLARAMQ